MRKRARSVYYALLVLGGWFVAGEIGRALGSKHYNDGMPAWVGPAAVFTALGFFVAAYVLWRKDARDR